MGVAAAVGPHGEWSRSSGVAHSAHRLAQEVGGAPRRVGPALAQPCHQHVAGSGGHGPDRVIAPLASVVVALRTLLDRPVGRADRGVPVDGQRIIARSVPNGPGPSQQLPAHPVQLADSAPPKTPQKGTQRGWRLDRAAQHPIGSPSAQRVGVVDAVAAHQRRRHQGQQLVAGIRPTRRSSQINVVVDEFTQTQALGQSDRKDQPGIGHQAVVIEGDLDAVGMVKWQHLLGAPCFGSVCCFTNRYPRSKGALSYPFITPRQSPLQWSRP